MQLYVLADIERSHILPGGVLAAAVEAAVRDDPLIAEAQRGSGDNEAESSEGDEPTTATTEDRLQSNADRLMRILWTVVINALWSSLLSLVAVRRDRAAIGDRRVSLEVWAQLLHRIEVYLVPSEVFPSATITDAESEALMQYSVMTLLAPMVRSVSVNTAAGEHNEREQTQLCDHLRELLPVLEADCRREAAGERQAGELRYLKVSSSPRSTAGSRTNNDGRLILLFVLLPSCSSPVPGSCLTRHSALCLDLEMASSLGYSARCGSTSSLCSASLSPPSASVCGHWWTVQPSPLAPRS